jgi:TolA-binding protein
MTSKNRIAAALVLLAAACATGGGGGRSLNERFFQADQKLPAESAFTEDAERAFYKEARTYEARGEQALSSGNADQARAELAEAAKRYAEFKAKFGTSEYQIPIAFHAAELFLYAQQFQAAAEQADRAAADPYANPKTKAMASHLSSQAWLNAANQDVKAGSLEPIKIVYQEQRRGPLAPKAPPGAWGRFVAATDKYLANLSADPELQKPANERRLLPPSRLALIAAEVEYAFDNMEDAQRRFASILEQWPGEGEILEDAVPIYLQTFLALGDQAGYQAALQKARAMVDAETQKAKDPAQQQALGKVKDALSRADAGARFGEAQRLLDAGKPGEAAQAFEALAAEPGAGAEAATALHNAALAWDKANDAARATAVRQRIVKEFPDAKVTPNNVLLLATAASKKGAHGDAAKLYGDFLERWPDHANRCVALQNVAAELDQAKKTGDAAEGYLRFGTDAGCAKVDPNFSARALYRAGVLFTGEKKRAKAKEAFQAAAGVQGVTDTVAKSQVDDAKKRLKGL